MRKWTGTGGLVFLAAMSVYAGGALSVAAENGATAASEQSSATVQLLDETAGPATAPTSQPTGGQKLSESKVNVTQAGTVDVQVSNANIHEVLHMLSLQSEKNIIASKEVRGTVTASLYNVTLKEALDAILKANGYTYREKGNFIYVYTPRELEEIEKSERKMSTEVFHLYYTPAANAVNMIKPVLSSEAQVSFTAAPGSGLDGKETGGASHAVEDIVIVRDYADNLEKARKVIREVDRRPQQVLVEATIVSARLNEDNALGIDFTILGGVDFSTITTQNGQFLRAGLDENAAVANRANSIGTGDNFTKNINGGFRAGLVTDNVAVFLSALETVTDTMVLANPKVLTLNKQKGEVLVGREDGYLTTTFTESTAVQTVEFLQTGTRLIFRPFIGDDGYIRMEIHPEDSDGKVVNGLPQKTTTEITTNIMVKDGHTIVIGGLFRESDTTARRQIPGLGNLPVVGALFRSQADTAVREEIIVLLTPHIVKDDAAYSAASQEQLAEIEKMRVGMRKGMMFFGRDRLAENCYDAAVAELNKPEPNRKKALWHLDCATNLNPQFIEAINLKQELTGRELSYADKSTIRDFVKQQIMAEREQTPATQPVEPVLIEDAAAVVPATQPVAEVLATQPTEQVVAEIPTTQPVAEETTSEPMEEVTAAEELELSPVEAAVVEDAQVIETIESAEVTEPVEAVELIEPVIEAQETAVVEPAEVIEVIEEAASELVELQQDETIESPDNAAVIAEEIADDQIDRVTEISTEVIDGESK